MGDDALAFCQLLTTCLRLHHRFRVHYLAQFMNVMQLFAKLNVLSEEFFAVLVSRVRIYSYLLAFCGTGIKFIGICLLGREKNGRNVEE